MGGSIGREFRVGDAFIDNDNNIRVIYDAGLDYYSGRRAFQTVCVAGYERGVVSEWFNDGDMRPLKVVGYQENEQRESVFTNRIEEDIKRMKAND